MKVGDYVRTKKRGFQHSQIAQIKSMSKDSGYKNQYFIELDHNLLPDYEYHIYEEDIVNTSPNIIDLIEVGDYVNGYKVSFSDKEPVMGEFVQCDYEVSFGTTNHYRFYEADIKSIVTKEQFENIEYKIGE